MPTFCRLQLLPLFIFFSLPACFAGLGCSAAPGMPTEPAESPKPLVGDIPFWLKLGSGIWIDSDEQPCLAGVGQADDASGSRRAAQIAFNQLAFELIGDTLSSLEAIRPDEEALETALRTVPTTTKNWSDEDLENFTQIKIRVPELAQAILLSLAGKESPERDAVMDELDRQLTKRIQGDVEIDDHISKYVTADGQTVGRRFGGDMVLLSRWEIEEAERGILSPPPPPEEQAQGQAEEARPDTYAEGGPERAEPRATPVEPKPNPVEPKPKPVEPKPKPVEPKATPVAVAAKASPRRPSPILAVFDIQANGVNLKKGFLEGLGNHLAMRLTESKRFQVVPRSTLKQRILETQKESYKECYDQSCQIALGRELAAEKTLATQINKLGSRCTVSLGLYDLRKATAESAATHTGRCREDDLFGSVNAAIDKLIEP